MSRSAYPLSWPDGWKRAKHRVAAQFGKQHREYDVNAGATTFRGKKRLSIFDAIERALGELQRMGVKRDDIIISTNIPTRLDGLPRSDRGEPSDPGVCIYWQKRGQPMRCMAVDQYTRVADNLAAIAATLEAMRAIERHGGAEILNRAFTGFAALPAHASESWREVLGIRADQQPRMQLVEERFRLLAHVHHPDKGGDRAKFEQIIAAREAARQELA